MADEKVDTRGLTCPRPLIETRKKLNKMKPGQTMEIIGDHAPSKKEIPDMLVDSGHKVVSVSEKKGVWKVVIKKN